MKTLEEAKEKIIKELNNRKIICDSGTEYNRYIISENFRIEIKSGKYYAYWSNEERDYTEVDIAIRTREYPEKRKGLRKFNVTTGNYDKLVEKINVIIKEDKKMKMADKLEKKNEIKNEEILKKKLEGLGAKKMEFGRDYIIKTKYFDIEFSFSSSGIHANIDKDYLEIDKAIELIKKLQ